MPEYSDIHLIPQSPTPEGSDTEYEEIDSDTPDEDPEPPAPLVAYSTGGHEHHWQEGDEGRSDGMLTAICTICGAGMHYHKDIHSVTDGNLNNHA